MSLSETIQHTKQDKNMCAATSQQESGVLDEGKRFRRGTVMIELLMMAKLKPLLFSHLEGI
jgi:hypothetical protein